MDDKEKCPKCGANVIYYHLSSKMTGTGRAATDVRCSEKCSGYSVIRHIDHDLSKQPKEVSQ